jgi:hypothetical protein
MKSGIALYLHSARRVRLLLLAVAGLLAAFQILLAFAARSLDELHTLPQLMALIPEFLRQLLGTSLLTLMSFRGIASLGYLHVAILAVLVGLMVALGTEPLTEIETRFLDLVLAHPLPRHWVVTRTILLLTSSVALLLGAMMVGTRVGLFWLVPRNLAVETFRPIPLMSLNLAVLLLFWGGIALLLASIGRRRSVAAGAAAWLAAACYMVDLIAQVWKPMVPWSRYSPFHYYRSLNLIAESSNAHKDILILAGAALAAFALSYVIFHHRDL